MEPVKHETKTFNPLFPFMGIGSLIYAFFYTFFLYKNSSGITYPFFVGGTCLFFFLYLKKSGLTAKKFSVFITVSLMLLGISTCLTDSRILLFFNKLGIFCLFFYLVLHNLYQDKNWGLPKYAGAITTVVFQASAIYLSLLQTFPPSVKVILRRTKSRKEKENMCFSELSLHCLSCLSFYCFLAAQMLFSAISLKIFLPLNLILIFRIMYLALLSLSCSPFLPPTAL